MAHVADIEKTVVGRSVVAAESGAVHAKTHRQILDADVVHADAVELRFEDDGIAFNPLLAADPVVPSSLVAAVPGGFGLMLTRKAASQCSYERLQGRNVFTVRLARAAQPA